MYAVSAKGRDVEHTGRFPESSLLSKHRSSRIYTTEEFKVGRLQLAIHKPFSNISCQTQTEKDALPLAAFKCGIRRGVTVFGSWNMNLSRLLPFSRSFLFAHNVSNSIGQEIAVVHSVRATSRLVVIAIVGGVSVPVRSNIANY